MYTENLEEKKLKTSKKKKRFFEDRIAPSLLNKGQYPYNGKVPKLVTYRIQKLYCANFNSTSFQDPPLSLQ